ncbi:PAS domain-containing protein [Deinococcus ruber]|uniref:PAS domain-containing protein n=1 Tax=Deinococcus ruber TaxID=1848197 RepID=A0A918F5P2_9DEIO|nr:PAS domain-containing protein [Deinococcus ruber]GGR03391.1 hypothetical protein GCM10008957_15330 [Deinococcus ruber]
MAWHTAAELQRTLDLITSINAEGCFVTVNAASSRLLGYPPEALIGRRYLEFVHPDDRERSLENAAQLKEARAMTTLQNRYVR